MGNNPRESRILHRRTFLQGLGTAGLTTVLAGCSGDSEAGASGDDGENGDDTDTATTESEGQPVTDGSFDCADLTRGSQVFDPDGRRFQVIWDYPETFGDVEREIANTDSLAGARLGHLASKKPGSWPFIIQLNQNTSPTDADSADRYVNSPVYESASSITYEGRSVERSMASSGTNHTWRMAIPGRSDGEFHTTTVLLGVDNDGEYRGCEETAVSVAEGLMGSFRPNPAL